jgi:hypothetical protein
VRFAPALVSFALGCGRVGFEVCAGCGGNGPPPIERVQVVSPGSASTLSISGSLAQSKGNLLLAATYFAYSPGAVDTVSDTANQTWTSLAAEQPKCGSDSNLRWWYTIAASDQQVTITTSANTLLVMGAFFIEYSGVDELNPIDMASGRIAPASTTMMDAGSLDIAEDELVVAAFADIGNAPESMAPAGSAHLLAHDDLFAAMAEDAAVTAGTYTATATAMNGTSCWLGASIALRPR